MFFFFPRFFLLVGRFSIGCGSEFRAEVAYLDVGSSDLEQIHGKNYFHEISDIFMDKIYETKSQKCARRRIFVT